MTIKEWLDNKGSYKDGLKLYESFSNHNKNILRNLSRRKSAVNLQKLVYEIKKLESKTVIKSNIEVKLVAKNINPTQKELAVKEFSVYEKKQSIWFHQLPEELHETLLEANNTFKEKCMLKVQLNDQPNDAIDICNALQVRISNLTKINDLAWSKIDYFFKYRQLPLPPKDDLSDLTPAQLLRKEQNVFSSISRLNKRIKTNTEKIKKTNDKTFINRFIRSIDNAKSSLLTKEELLIKIKKKIDEKQ